MSSAARVRRFGVRVIWLWRPALRRHEPIGVCPCCWGPMDAGRVGRRLCEYCVECPGQKTTR